MTTTPRREVSAARRRLWSGWPLHPLRRRRRRCPNAASVGRGRLHRRHLQMRRSAGANLLYEAANVMLTRDKGQLKLKDWAFAIAKRSTIAKRELLGLVASRSLCTRCCETERPLSRRRPTHHETGDRIELPQGATPEGGSRRRRAFCSTRSSPADCVFNLAALFPAYPIKRQASAQRTQAPESVDTPKSSALDVVDGPAQGTSNCRKVVAGAPPRGRPSMPKYIRIGVDIAKNSFQVHALESEDCSATKRKLSRSGIVKFLAEVEPCAIGMEACGSAHYWARRFRAMGHEVKLTPPIYVKPYVKRGKNDAADAATICEAMSRPNMRFVAVKSEDQQATLMAHKTRELLIKQRTMSVNALRGHLAEFGVIAAKGISHVEELVERAAAADLPAMVQATLGVLLAQLRSLDAATDELERAIVANHRRDPVSRLAASVPGVGALAASAILASAPDPQAFKSGRDFAAWLGATPKQNSTGGKEKLGSITKQGNRYIRRLLVLGAISVLRAAPKRKGALCDWLAALRAANRPRSWPWRWPTSSPGSSGRSSLPARPSAPPSTLRPNFNPGQRTRKENAGSRVWRARRTT